jgi:hypothetical protein
MMPLAWRRLVLACVVVSALSLVMGPALFTLERQNTDQIEELAESNSKALCNTRDGLRVEIAQSKRLLENPDMFPEFNDPSTLELIQADLEETRTQLNELDDLDC